MPASHVSSRVSARLAPFGTTIFSEMTRLANEHGAINLAQGFPDFDCPEFLKDAAEKAMRDGHNQYARSAGDASLVLAIAEDWRARHGVHVDPMAHVTVTSGCTEAIAAAIFGLVNPGDKVVLFEPYYDSYRACVAMAGGEPVFVAMRPAAGGRFAPDLEEFARVCESRPRLVILNSPHNPTGTVLTREELGEVARLCAQHDLLVLSDEVYEHLVLDDAARHIPLATLPGMWERTVTCSSLGKTFSATGWKIGWTVAPDALSAGVRAAHQFLTFATSSFAQHAAAAAISVGGEYVRGLRAEYASARDFLCDALAGIGFRVVRPQGTYFVLADHRGVLRGDDIEACRVLTRDIGVAAIPASVFCERKEIVRNYVRFAFCKKRETLERAVDRLSRLRVMAGSPR